MTILSQIVELTLIYLLQFLIISDTIINDSTIVETDFINVRIKNI